MYAAARRNGVVDKSNAYIGRLPTQFPADDDDEAAVSKNNYSNHVTHLFHVY